MLPTPSFAFLILCSIECIRHAIAGSLKPTCAGDFDQQLLGRFPRLPQYRKNSDLCIYQEHPEEHIQSLNCLCLPDNELQCNGKFVIDAVLRNNPILTNICFSKCKCGDTFTHPDFGGFKLPKIKISSGADTQDHSGSTMSTGSVIPGTGGTSGGGSSGSTYYSLPKSPSQSKCEKHCSSFAGCSRVRRKRGCSDSVCSAVTEVGEQHFHVGKCISASSMGLGLGLGLGKRDSDPALGAGCLCNSSYTGKDCCFSKTGIVHTRDLMAF